MTTDFDAAKQLTTALQGSKFVRVEITPGSGNQVNTITLIFERGSDEAIATLSIQPQTSVTVSGSTVTIRPTLGMHLEYFKK